MAETAARTLSPEQLEYAASDVLYLHRLREKLMERLVRDGRLTAGHARTLLVVPDPEALAKELIARDLTVRQAERKSDAKKHPGGKPYRDPNIAALESSVSNVLGLKTQITHSVSKKGDKGEVKIAYASLEQLDEIVRRLSRS